MLACLAYSHAIIISLNETSANNHVLVTESSVAAALDCFSEARGLGRSQQMGADLTAMGAAAASTSQPAAENDASFPGPTTAATSYERYLRRLGRDSTQGANERVKTEACLRYEPSSALRSLPRCSLPRLRISELARRLMAHAYSNHMLLLTKGSTMGARSAEKLNLFQKKAIHTYRSYPFDVIGKVR